MSKRKNRPYSDEADDRKPPAVRDGACNESMASANEMALGHQAGFGLAAAHQVIHQGSNSAHSKPPAVLPGPSMFAAGSATPFQQHLVPATSLPLGALAAVSTPPPFPSGPDPALILQWALLSQLSGQPNQALDMPSSFPTPSGDQASAIAQSDQSALEALLAYLVVKSDVSGSTNQRPQDAKHPGFAVGGNNASSLGSIAARIAAPPAGTLVQNEPWQALESFVPSHRHLSAGAQAQGAAQQQRLPLSSNLLPASPSLAFVCGGNAAPAPSLAPNVAQIDQAAAIQRLLAMTSSSSLQGAASSLDAVLVPSSSSSTMASEAVSSSTVIASSSTARPRRTVPLAITSDKANISECQCLIRLQIVLFEATEKDIAANAQGRNRPITIGQVGLACRHCLNIPADQRSRGAHYFPSAVTGIYQAAQNMNTYHFQTSCARIPEETKGKIASLQAQKSSLRGGGKKYWKRAAEILSVADKGQGGLRFIK